MNYSPQIQSRYTEAVALTWQHWRNETEAMLPYPTVSPDCGVSLTEQANENNQCKALAEFWQTELGKDLAVAIQHKVQQEINTPELRAWQEDFDRRYPVVPK